MSQTKEPYSTFIVEYPYDGAKWVLEVKAQDEAEAMIRLNRASCFGKVSGELVATIPALPGTGPVVRFIVWLRNILRHL